MWIRDVEVIAGNKKFVNNGKNALEIDFDIPFSSNKEEPDISEVIIYNLSDSTINQIKADGEILVNAGYINLKNKGNILTADIEEVLVEWEGVHKRTTILASDGGKNWRRKSFNKSYAPNTKASSIMRDLANLMGYNIIEIKPKNDLIFPRGYTVSGKASKSLKDLVRDTNSKMFINKNRLIIRDKNTGHDIEFVLSEKTGLIGNPEREVEEEGEGEKTKEVIYWRVESLLNPLYEPDAIVRVKSRALNGRFRIVEGKHRGDFITELKLKGV